MEQKHLIMIISSLFTVVLLLMGYLWNTSDKRQDTMESRHIIMVEKFVDLQKEVSELKGTIEGFLSRPND